MQKSIRTLLAAGLVAAATLPAAAQQGSGVAAPAPRSAGGSTNITVTNDDGSTVQLTVRGDEISAFVDGKRVPEDRIERSDKTIKILGEDGEVLREFNLGSGGGVWTVDGEGRLAERSIVVGGDGKPRAFMGVTLGDLDETAAAQMKLDPGKVVTITTVTPGQPAETAGLQAHDIVIRVNGQDEASAEALRKAIAAKKPGETLQLRVLRGGAEEEVEITLGEAPQMNAYAFAPSANGQWSGFLEGADGGAWALSMEQMQEQLAHGQEAWEEAMNRLSEEWENLDLTISDEDRAKLEEALARVRESLENLDVEIDMPRVHLFGQGGRQAVIVPPTPAAPAAPDAPPAGTYRFTPNAATAESDERLKKIEERMDRIEALLQRLAEKE